MANINKEIQMNIHNRFDIEVIDSQTGQIKQKAQAFNVICDTFWSKLFSQNQSQCSDVCYGSGTGIPAKTDTRLFNYIGIASSNSADGAESYITMSNLSTNMTACMVLKRVLLPGTSVGVNITEVGIGQENICYTHAMLQDMNGNPISIYKTNTDLINIYARVYLHWVQDRDIFLFRPDGGAPQTKNLIDAILLGYSPTQTSWNYFVRESYSSPYWVTGKNRLFNNIGTYNNIRIAKSTDLNYPNCDLNNKRMTFPALRFETTDANYDGFNMLALETGRYNNYYWGTNILILTGGTIFPSANITSESVGVGDGATTKFKTKFDFPYNAQVYVNGILQQSGVSVKKMPRTGINQNNYGYYFNVVYKLSNNLIIPSPYFHMTQSDVTTTDVWENHLCGMPVITRFSTTRRNPIISFSDDWEHWTDVASAQDQYYVDIPVDCRTKKYFQFKNPEGNYINFYDSLSYASYDGYNIIFDTPPAAGDVITIDYTTDYIPKDGDHVLDISLILQFGEYTPPNNG